MEKVIISVVGKDQIGIIAKICTYLADHEVSILDITQSIVGGYFNMMMIANIAASKTPFNTIQEDLYQLGQEINIDIKVQHSEIFESMHRI